MKTYLDLAQHILDNGVDKKDRTGTGTRSVFGAQIRYDLSKGFPLFTTKRIPFRLVTSELLWFIKGDTNIKYLLEHNNKIWNEWAFLNYIESNEYQGQLDKDFGVKAANDADYQALVDEEMAEFEQLILTDESFAEKYGDLGRVYGAQWRS